jgi:phosphoribosylanthranilate isomerase
MTPRIKICCISSLEEARLAVACGAHALGLVGRMPSGPGVISDETIADIARAAPPPVATFLLTCETGAEAIIAHARRTHTSVLQLVDAVSPETYGAIRAALPSVKIVQVLHVRGADTLDEARASAPHVDALLLDSGNPTLAVKELGGTGRVHDWAVSRRIVEESPVPVFLAGGLNPDNVARALAEVRPYGLDICSGVRSDGRLDGDKLARLIQAARAA